MYHHVLNTFIINMVLASALLTFSLTSLTQACGPKAEKKIEPTYDEESDTVKMHHSRITGSRLRRAVVVEQEIEGEDALTTPAMISNTEVFYELDLDFDDEVSVIEWSLEGGSVRDFWALLTRHDSNGDELISRDEFAPVQVQLLY